MTTPPAPVYPPERHLLRDLALDLEHHDGVTRATMPAVEHLLDDGAVRLGAIATFVDVIGGGQAAIAAAPGWIATADLTLHLLAAAGVGVLEATSTVVRRGRTTVVLETTVEQAGAPVARATMTFAVLPRRDSNPVLGVPGSGPVRLTMANATSGFAAPWLDAVGIVDAGAGACIPEVREYIRNSLGGMQGGVVAALAERAAQRAAHLETGRAARVADLHLHYFALNRQGPIEATPEVTGQSEHRATVRVETTDAGAGRVTAVALAAVELR